MASGLSEAATEDPRDAAILGPALEVFGRLGYQKTSMEEVARAAGVSRQGLYVFFANKAELFRASVGHALEMRLRAAREELGRTAPEFGVAWALSAWLGEYRGGLMGAETDELVQTARRLAGEVVQDAERRLIGMLGEAIAGTELRAVYARVEVSPDQLAKAVYAMARGLRITCAGAEEFRREIGVAGRVLWLGRG